MKLLILSPFFLPDKGGVETHLYKTIKGLNAYNNYDVELLTYNSLNSPKKAKQEEEIGNCKIYRINWYGRGLFNKFEKIFGLNLIYLFPGLFYALIQKLKNKKYDVIHAHGLIAGLIVVFLKRRVNARLILSTHAIYGKKSTLFTVIVSWVCKTFDHIVAVGEPSRLELNELGVPNTKISTLENWVDDIYFQPDINYKYKEFCGYKKDEIVILFVGRLIGIKGELLLLNSIKSSNNNVKYIFVGSGPNAEILREYSKTNNNVKFFENIAENELLNIYSISNIFVSPVMYEEGFASVYLEALAHGLFIIASKRGCLPFFLDEENSILMEEINEEKINKTIEFIINSEKIINLRKKRSDDAQKKYSSKNVEILKLIYENASLYC